MTNYADYSNGWEMVENQEAVRYYQLSQGKKEAKWYRKWIGQFTMFNAESMKQALAKANIRVEGVMFDASGYAIVPQSSLR